MAVWMTNELADVRHVGRIGCASLSRCSASRMGEEESFVRGTPHTPSAWAPPPLPLPSESRHVTVSLMTIRLLVQVRLTKEIDTLLKVPRRAGMRVDERANEQHAQT